MSDLAGFLIIVVLLVIIWIWLPKSYPDVSGKWQSSLPGAKPVMITKTGEKEFAMQSDGLLSKIIFIDQQSGYIESPLDAHGALTRTKFSYDAYSDILRVVSRVTVPGGSLSLVGFMLRHIS